VQFRKLPGKELRVSLAGLGRMGMNHLRVLSSIPEVSEVLVFDAAIRHHDFDKKVAFADSFEDLLAASPLYLVVALPTHLHHQFALAAADAGVTTLIEKPISSNLSEAIEIAERFRSQKTKGFVGHIERFNPALSELRQKVRSGLIGETIQISTKRVSPFTPRISDVGVAVDLASHDIDFVHWLTGEEYVHINSLYRSLQVGSRDDLVVTCATLQSGTMVNHLVNRANPRKERVTEVLGTEGLLVADSLIGELRLFTHGQVGSEWQSFQYLRGSTEGEEHKFQVPAKEPLVLEHHALIQHLKNDDHTNLCTMEEGVKVMRVIEEMKIPT
jgi:UDP-N-acetylglucosamine 3-dehydrogenase